MKEPADVDIMDWQEEMGFSSREAYERFLDGKDDPEPVKQESKQAETMPVGEVGEILSTIALAMSQLENSKISGARETLARLSERMILNHPEIKP